MLTEKLGTFINACSAITGMSRRWCQPGNLTCKKFMKKIEEKVCILEHGSRRSASFFARTVARGRTTVNVFSSPEYVASRLF